MTRGRNRNRATEEYVAKKQINAIGGGLQLEELLKIIDAKDGDYYKAELSPREGWREAYEHFGMTGKSKTLDLQEEIIAEMKAYYGLNNSTPLPAQSTRLNTPPPSAKAQQFKDNAMQEVMTHYENDDTVNKNMKDWIEKNNKSVATNALFLALGLGGIAYHNSREPNPEEEEGHIIRV